jgi:outer membrane immunogenic protein
MSRFAFALLAAAAIAGPAVAQEAKNFNGPFIGGQIGWQQDRQSLDLSTVPPSTIRAKFPQQSPCQPRKKKSQKSFG